MHLPLSQIQCSTTYSCSSALFFFSVLYHLFNCLLDAEGCYLCARDLVLMIIPVVAADVLSLLWVKLIVFVNLQIIIHLWLSGFC